MTPITLFTASCRGDRFNTMYPYRRIVTNPEEMAEAARFDHVFAEYRNGHRSISDFLRSDCLPFDCDNDHSDAQNEWKTPEDVEKAFPGVPFYVVYSRHHMLQKGERSQRPRFHVIFPIDPVTDGNVYRKMKEAVLSRFPFFDSGAGDAARFFYGVPSPIVKLYGGEANEAE